MSEALCRLDELLVHRLEHLQIAVDNHGDGASAVDGVALNVAYEALVGVAVDEDAQVHHVAQALVEQRHDALHYYHRLRLYVYGLLLAVALQVRVRRLLDGAALAQLVNLLYEQFPVEGVGMVEVDGTALLFGHVRRVVIVRVERHYSHVVRRQCLNNLFHYRCLAGTSAAGNTDYRNLVVCHNLMLIDILR